jgi:hypothetical protein
MDDVFDVNQSGADASNSEVESELAALIDVRGASLVEQPAQLRLLLTQACPDAVRAIDAVVAASTCGVASRLRAASDDATLPALLARCVQQLRSHGVDDPDWAAWAVRTWAHAFALPTSAAQSAPLPPPVATRAPFAPWRDTPHTPPVAPPIPAASHAPIANAPFEPVAPAIDETLFTEPTADAVAMAPMADPSLRERLEPAFAEPVPPAIEPAPDLPLREMPETPIEVVEPFRPEARAEEAPSEEFAPRWAQQDAAMRKRRPRRAWIAVTSVIALVVLTAAYVASRNRETTAIVASTPLVVSNGAPLPAQKAEPPATTTTPASSTPPQPEPEPVTAASPGPTAEAPVQQPPVAPPPSVEPRDATPTPAQVPTATPKRTPKPLPTPAAAAAARPVPGPRPSIARIEAPRVAAGKPFTVTLRLTGEARGVTAVERRFFVSEGSWPRNDTVAIGSGLRRSGQNLLVWFRAPAAPARAAVEFVVVGRDGSRSGPKSLTINVAEVTPSVAVAAPPNEPCTQATCGAVVETREVQVGTPAGAPVYRIIVRTDDHESHSFTAPYRLQTGTRVRLVGGRLVIVAVDR